MSTNVSTDSARETLRREHGVRLVTETEEGTAVSALPAGVYGFTGSPALASPLFSVRRYRNFEVHRLPAGPSVLGCVTREEAAQLSHLTQGSATIKMFPDAEGPATTLVSVSYDRIVQHRQYSVRNAEAITLQVVAGHTMMLEAS